MQLVGANGTSYGPTVNPFTLLSPTTPTGLVPGVNYFTSDGTALVPYNTTIQTSSTWQGATINGLVAGTYRFTYIPIANPSVNWAPMDSFILSSIVVLNAGIVGGSSVYGAAVALNNTPAQNAASAIDANSNLANLFTGLTTDQQISDAASQTLPLLTGASMIAANSALLGINRVIQARIEGNLGMSSGESFYGNKHLWIKPFGSWADQDTQNGVAGYKAETIGLAIGVDGTVTPALRIGGAFAYAKSDINGQSTVAPQSANVDIYQLIGYGSYSLDERTDINFQIDAGQNINKGRRQIAFTSSTASSDYDSQTAHVGVGIGRTYALSGQTSLTPAVRADYTWIKDKGYVETGAGLLNLDVKGRSAESLVIGVDGKLVHKLNDQTSLLANLGVGYDAMIKQAAITSAFAGAPGAAFVTYGVDPSPWLMRAGIGAVYRTKAGVELTGRYDAEVREKFTNQTASVKFRWAF